MPPSDPDLIEFFLGRRADNNLVKDVTLRVAGLFTALAVGIGGVALARSYMVEPSSTEKSLPLQNCGRTGLNKFDCK